MLPVNYAPRICDVSARSLRMHELGTLKWAGRASLHAECIGTPTETQNPGVKEEPLITQGHL